MNSISTKELLTEGSTNFKKNFGEIVLLQLLLIGFFVVICIIALIPVRLPVPGINIQEASMDNILSLGDIIFITIFIVLLLLVLPVILSGYQYFYVKLFRKDNELSLGSLFSGFNNFWSIWLSRYFSGVLILGGTILLMIPLLILIFLGFCCYLSISEGISADFTYLGNYLISGNFKLLFSIIIIIFSIYWAIKFFFTTMTAIDKNLKPGEALYYGTKLIEGYRWKMFLALLIPLTSSITLIILEYYDRNPISFLIVSLFNIFVLIPWIYSITATTYIRLSKIIEVEKPAVLSDILELREKELDEKQMNNLKTEKTTENDKVKKRKGFFGKIKKKDSPEEDSPKTDINDDKSETENNNTEKEKESKNKESKKKESKKKEDLDRESDEKDS